MLQPPRWSDVVRDSELAELRQLPHESVALRGWRFYEVVRQPLPENVVVRDWEIDEVPLALRESVYAHACPQPVELKVSRSVQDR